MNYMYEVALSFAGEDRAFTEAFAEGLREAGVEVFYDSFYTEELWGEYLLEEITHRSSLMIVVDTAVNRNHHILRRLVDDRRQAIGLREPGGAGNSTHIGYNYLAIHDKSVNLLKSKG